MTLSDFAAFSTTVSGIAVTVSLIYLSIQTRQNTRHTRALIQQGATARTIAITLAQVQGNAMAAWLKGNRQDATPEAVQKAQFFIQCQTSVTALEDIFNQHNDGLMKDEVFARNCQIHRGLLSEPGYREYWNAYRSDAVEAAPKFCAFVDSLCTEPSTDFKFRI